MDKKKRSRIIIAVMLLLAIANFSRLKGTENIRTVEFLSIFAIGALSGLLIYSIVSSLRDK